MEAKKICYECTHENQNGHVMTLRWGDVLEVRVDFMQNVASVSARGVIKNVIDLTGTTIRDFELIIENMQDAADALSRFEPYNF